MWWQVLAGLGILAAAKPEATLNAAKSTGAIVATGIKSAAAVFEPLGIRLNNPGNIEINAGNKWVGEVRPSAHKRYAQFSHPVYGIRALTETIETYGLKYGIHDLRGVISRWAPSKDGNDTESYIAHVSKVSGVEPRGDIRSNLFGVVSGIILHENGKQPYSKELIQEAIRMSWDGI